MPRNPGDSDLYLPLFAGTELARRSGNLTRFPPGNLLGNIPPPRMRTQRVLGEAVGFPKCMLPPGEIITFLWHSEFGPIEAPGATNWQWDPAPQTPGEIQPIVISPGTPGNNIHVQQSGLLNDSQRGYLQSAIPVNVGFCRGLRQTISMRVWNNGFLSGDEVALTWAPSKYDYANGVSFGQLQSSFGAMGIYMERFSDRLTFRLGSNVASPGAFGGGCGGGSIVDMPELVSGNSVYVELFHTAMANGVQTLEVHIDGAPRATFTCGGGDSSHGHIVAVGDLYPSVYIDPDQVDGTRTAECFFDPTVNDFRCPIGKTVEIYTNTWSLEVL